MSRTRSLTPIRNRMRPCPVCHERHTPDGICLPADDETHATGNLRSLERDHANEWSSSHE